MFRFLTAGESHGPGLTITIEGIPAGLEIIESDIDNQLRRRQKGYGRGGRMKIEKDHADIKGGIRHGITLGSPISMWIENKDFVNWKEAMDPSPVNHTIDKKQHTRIVPGHADFAGALKYKQHDLRNILERASARETTSRVAAGAVARTFLNHFNIDFKSRVLSIGNESTKESDVHQIDWIYVESSEVRAENEQLNDKFKNAIDNSKKARTTIGGIFQVVVFGVPVGLGSHIQWDRKIDGQLAQALMSINAVKGVEIGNGFANTRRPGKDVHDVLVPNKEDKRNFSHLTNHAGGLEGGITNGEPIIINVAIKPIATMTRPLPSVDINTGDIVKAAYHRSDICQVPPACVIGEAMASLVIAKLFLEKFGGDELEEVSRNYYSYVSSHKDFGSE